MSNHTDYYKTVVEFNDEDQRWIADNSTVAGLTTTGDTLEEIMHNIRVGATAMLKGNVYAPPVPKIPRPLPSSIEHEIVVVRPNGKVSMTDIIDPLTL